MILVNIIGSTLGVAQALPTEFGTITVEPADVTAQSTVTITVTISGNTPSEVRVTVEECNGNTGVCYSDIQNMSMTEVSSGRYQTTLTLKHADATNMTAIVLAKINDQWEHSPKKIVVFSAAPNGNGDDNGGTPGFELLLVLVAVGLIVVIGKRKRF